jgi:homoserine dehydrogenase
MEGLTAGIDRELATARRVGQVVRLVGTAEFRDELPRLSVRPQRLDPGHPLATVRGKDKGVIFHTDTMGDITVIGGALSPRGAAAALLRDVLAIFGRSPGNTHLSGVITSPGSRDDVPPGWDHGRRES